jgi:hypothetical protein
VRNHKALHDVGALRDKGGLSRLLGSQALDNVVEAAGGQRQAGGAGGKKRKGARSAAVGACTRQRGGDTSAAPGSQPAGQRAAPALSHTQHKPAPPSSPYIAKQPLPT